ncbi:MAG: 3-deoxy-7-phosphoheptulonate synthase [Erysipelotrichaceae bacterium]|nr:3-deoxy-7-phosphoheptulonate synthase [Erysipelotrichaceae bacterium]
MIITMKNKATKAEIEEILELVNKHGLKALPIHGDDYRVFGIVGDTSKLDIEMINAYSCVDNVLRVSTPFKKVSRTFHPENTIIKVGNLEIGGNKVVMIGGPCSIEGKDQIVRIAHGIKENGGDAIRGGAYKPRTSPYAFQGLATEGILNMVEARNQTGLPIVTEIMDASKIDEFVKHVDIIQVGARNMQNFELLKALGKIDKPILLKRGLANTIEEWLMSAEYIMAGGNNKVILCERGIRTFEKYTRNTLDLSVIPLVKKLSHLPIVIDPSHATGKADLVESMCLAAVAAGADGLIIEAHYDPRKAWSDASQTITLEAFGKIKEKCKKIAEVIGREM